MRILAPLALAVTLLLAACSHDADDAPEPGWTRLANGLRVCIRPIEGAKDVAVMTTFDIGSDHDPAGQSGLAHLVEHLYVTAAAGATATRTAEEWENRYSGRCGATTFRDFTRVHVVVAADALDAEVTDVASRMSGLRVEQSDLDRERPRVLQQMAEGRNAEADAAALRLAIERLRPRPHGGGNFGVESDVVRISLADARDRCRRFYAPVNARLVIAGAVDPVATAALVASRFASIAPGERAPTPEECTAPQPGEVEATSDAPLVDGFVRKTAVCVAFLAPSGSDDDAAAYRLFQSFATREAGTSELRVLPSGTTQVLAFQARDGTRPATEVAAIVDDMAKRFASHTPTPEEIGQVRKAVDPAATVDWLTSRSATPDWVAALLVEQARSRTDTQRVLESLDSGEQPDLARFAAKWLAPERRVVVIVHGVANAHPPERPLPDWLRRRLERLESPRLEDTPELRITLVWDETTQTTHRKLGDRECADLAALEESVVATRDAWAKRGMREVRARLVMKPNIPWSEVTPVVRLIQRSGIDRIEFTDPEAPAKPK